MRVVIGFSVLFALAGLSLAQRAAKPERPRSGDVRRAAPIAPKGGINTPGVQIPFASLKADLEYVTPTAPEWIAVTDAILIRNKSADGLDRIDARAKEVKLGDPIGSLSKPCSGVVNA